MSEHTDGEQSGRHDRFARIESIFSELCSLQLENPEQVDARLNELCDDQAMADEIRAMLKVDQQPDALIDAPALSFETEPDEFDIDEPLPDSIGPFTIISVLGRGGMGIVYQARQQSPSRRVALKVIAERSMHERIRKRFEREADILARLNHPGIATIYESGLAESHGARVPYVAMELVEGEPITTYASSNSLAAEQRVSLIRDVCRAVGHAHDMGIVHRDLKPSNVLVDHDGRVKVLDFGIALDMQVQERTQMTQTGQLLGTLQYMAPEQVDRTAHTTDASTDVYALGLLAYELLLGKPALDGQDSSMYELVRAIRDDEPDLIGTHDRSLRGDLETVIAKALSREKSRRYRDASALADDLDRYLGHQPIEARRASTWYQLRKFSQRNPILVGSVSTIMLVLIVAVFLIANALRLATQERTIAQQQQHAQQLIAEFVTDDLFSTANPDFDGDASIKLIDAMRLASENIPERFRDAPEAQATISETMGDQFRLMNDFEKAEFHLRRSVELSKDLPDLPVDVLINRFNSLADVYMDIDDLDTALEVVEEANEIMNHSTEVSPGIRIDTLVQHASLLYHMRDHEGSAAIFEQAADLGQRELPEYNGTVDAVSALAMVYTILGREDESLTMHLRGIGLRKKVNGPEHPATLQAQDNLAILYIRTGQLQEAIDLLTQVLDTRLRVFGPEHNKTFLTKGLLGRAYMENEEYEQAEQLITQAADGIVDVLGPDHRYTKTLRSYAHTLYQRTNNPERAAIYAPEPTPESPSE